MNFSKFLMKNMIVKMQEKGEGAQKCIFVFFFYKIFLRNMNIYDALALLPKLCYMHRRGSGTFSEGPGERNYKFIKKYKDQKCIRFSFGTLKKPVIGGK